MEKKVYKSYEELPLMLTVLDVAAVLGIFGRIFLCPQIRIF